MTTKSWLILLLGICISGFVITLLTLQYYQKRGKGLSGRVSGTTTPAANRTVRLRSFLLQSYRWGTRVPILASYIYLIQKRISFRHVGDEASLRRMTMTVVLIVAGVYGSISIVLFFMQPGIAFVILSVLCAVVIHSLVVDLWLNRTEKRLLVQMLDLFADVRHRYHQHGMIEEALYEAGEAGVGEAADQVLLIYEALTSPDPNEALERYYEIAPTDF